MTLNIAQLVGENCITIEDGEKVYGVIHPALSAATPVELDFAGVSVFASPFFNTAIGRLLADISPEQLNRLLAFKNLRPDGAAVLRRVIENSKEFFAKPEVREAINKMLRDGGDQE